MAGLEAASERGNEEQQPISAPILPLEKQREKGPVLLTEEARRIRWLLNGPLETAVTIMRHHTIEPDDTDFEPYYRPGQGAGSSGWHPFSQLPYTDPKVSELTLAVDPLDEWRDYWLTNHEEHVMAGDYDRSKERFIPLSVSTPDGPTSYEERTGMYLQMCCGTERPADKGTGIVVKARTGDFLTIHDFLSTVHPYLMSRRADVVAAMRDNIYRSIPIPSETELFVSLSCSDPPRLNVEREAEWKMTYHSKRPPTLDPAAQARMRKHPHWEVSRLVWAQRQVDKGLASALPRDHPGYRPLNLRSGQQGQ